MSNILKFWNRATNKNITISITNEIYLVEIMPKIKSLYGIEFDISIFCIGSKGQPITFIQNDKLEKLIVMSNSIRHFEVFWKNDKHGKQTTDMSPSSIGNVVSGYKRYVSASESAGDVTIGDPSGASVFIPAGALNDSATISIKTVMVENSKLNLPNGTKNVTRAVINDPNKVNYQVNNS